MTTRLTPARLGALAVLASIAATLFAACGSSAASAPYEYLGTVATPHKEITDFTLLDDDGDEFRFSEQQKKASLIFFGYTLCPDVCPTTLADLVRVKRQLGDKADDVNFIFVTVDPERDSSSAIKQRLAVFDPEFIGLTEERQALQPVWRNFGVIAKREAGSESAAGYLIAHSAFTYLVDEDMNLRVTFPFSMTPEDIAADVTHILDEERT